MSRVVAPPYDVISPREREEYAKRDPHNIVRLTLPKDPPQVAHGSRYDMAARYLDTWLEEGVFVEDKRPAIYVADCQFVHQGKAHTRRSFIAAVRLEKLGEGSILPHEQTFPRTTADRLALIEATRANLSPIFALYSDDGSVMAALNAAPMGEPLCTVVDRADVSTVLRAITDRKAIRRLQAELATRHLLIADGHHRYETAYMLRGPKPTGGPADYVMMACTSCLDPGLLILATHRVAKANGHFDADDFFRSAARHFEVSHLRGTDAHPADLLLNAMAAADGHAFGVYAAPDRTALLTLLDEELPYRNPAERSNEWKQLEASLLHWLILEQRLGIDADAARSGEYVRYIRDASEAIEEVDEGEYDLALLIKPTRISQMRCVAERNERMPPKSTYFYPKIPSGLVLRRL